MKNRDPESKSTNRVAALWRNPDGSMSMKLDLGVVLDWRDQPEYLLTVFENRPKE